MPNHPTNKETHLIRAIGLPTAVILFVSSIIGSGVYKKIAPMSLGLESPQLVLLAWGLAGVVTLLGVLATTEVGAMITESGGPYAYFKRIYGRNFAFYYGWSSLAVIQSASIASISYVFSQSVNALVALPRLGGAWETWTVLGIFTPSFDQLTDMLIFASFIFYGAIAFGVFVLRRKEPDTPRPYRAVGYPILPALFVIFCACLVVVTCFQRPREAGLGLALILLGTPFLLYWRRKSENTGFKRY